MQGEITMTVRQNCLGIFIDQLALWFCCFRCTLACMGNVFCPYSFCLFSMMGFSLKLHCIFNSRTFGTVLDTFAAKLVFSATKRYVTSARWWSAQGRLHKTKRESTIGLEHLYAFIDISSSWTKLMFKVNFIKVSFNQLSSPDMYNALQKRCSHFKKERSPEKG